MPDRPYVRVFHADLIRDYPDVWDDDAALATWLRLLVAADGVWPAPAELPRSARVKAVDALVSPGLVILMGAHRYRIKGLDADRSTRRNSASNAAALRWQRDGNAGTMPNNAEQSRTTQSSAGPRAPDDPWDAPEMEAVQWLAKHGCDIRPGNGYHRHLITMVEVHGVNAVVGMFDRLASTGMKQGDTQGYVFGAKDALNARSRPDLHALESEEAAEERAEVRSKRIQKQMWERRMELLRETGQWDDAWGPRPEVPA